MSQTANNPSLPVNLPSEPALHTIERADLLTYLAQYLNVSQFKDYCPNGLQVEGTPQIRKILCGVTASLALIEHAIAVGADTIVVHHGYFWRGEDMRVIGQKQRRLKLLLTHGINLLSYHLPLDAHPVVGNNAQLGQRLGMTASRFFGDNNLACLATLEVPLSLAGLATRIEQTLARAPLVIGEPEQAIKQVAWCTGAAQSFLQEAIDAGADVLISGEISEPTVHLAREMGVAYIAAGHHATERYGVQALGHHLARQFGLQVLFADLENPV